MTRASRAEWAEPIERWRDNGLAAFVWAGGDG
jgi:hypothetical protein